MRVVITGGAGFLGTRLAEALQRKGTLADAGGQQAIEQIVLFDQQAAVDRPTATPRRCEVVGGDISSPDDVTPAARRSGRDLPPRLDRQRAR